MPSAFNVSNAPSDRSPPRYRSALVWLQNDLRLHDNPTLVTAATQSERLTVVYIIDPEQFRPSRYQARPMGKPRWRFIQQALADVSAQLQQRKQRLVIRVGQPLQVMQQLLGTHNFDAVFSSEHPGWYERERWRLLSKRYPFIEWQKIHSQTLFSPTDLPFPMAELPAQFTQFRKQLERLAELPVAAPLPPPVELPPPVTAIDSDTVPAAIADYATPDPYDQSVFQGGEAAAIAHVEQYFAGRFASSYKETRNALDDWFSSTKFSPWLAQGCLSPRWLYARLRRYEQEIEANESTYWIVFELLWREYFQWYGHQLGVQLFKFRGIKNHSPQTSFYPARLAQWCSGTTPYPIVNACMKQLNATGYMSNRGRQLVASCFVHELGLDWRYGAAYFEQQLVDYDVASNWGNWQYLAGVGADPRGHRQFNLSKQTEMYDPKLSFITRWQGSASSGDIDQVDAADWPIMHHDNNPPRDS